MMDDDDDDDDDDDECFIQVGERPRTCLIQLLESESETGFLEGKIS